MTKDKKIKSLRAAKLIEDYFAMEIIRKNVFKIEGKKYDRLVAVDDDVFSAFIAANQYHQIHSETGRYPKVDVIGGYGLMSSRINPKLNGKRFSEAEMLEYVLRRLGVRRSDIGIVCSKGTNTGENLSAYATELVAANADRQKILFCLTKRLAGRFYLTQKYQRPSLQANYVWKEISLDEECQLYNGKGFAGCLPYLSELASVYDRYLRYTSGNRRFMATLDQGLSPKVMDAGDYLCKNYRLKMPEFSLRKMWQFVKTYVYFCLHKQECQQNLEEQIRYWQSQLQCYGLITIVDRDKISLKDVPRLSAW